MPAPLGNQNAIGNSGRPRTHDREKLAQELIEWASKPDSINLNKFCCTRTPPISPNVVLRFKDEDVEFRGAYEAAKAFLGARREEWLNADMMHVKAFDLNSKVYDIFTKEEEREQSQFEASLKQDDSKQPTKVVFEVNYGAQDKVEILPKALPNESSECA